MLALYALIGNNNFIIWIWLYWYEAGKISFSWVSHTSIHFCTLFYLSWLELVVY